MRRPTLALSALLLVVATACSAWRPVQRFDGWTLYSYGDASVDVARFRGAFEPARAAVERALGPFEQHVDVHALHGGDAQAEVHDLPGIGRTRVRAWHARGGGFFGDPSGIYAADLDAGTAAHELVHARFAESGVGVPLWFEEGLACVIGDGALSHGAWTIDGLACWPLRELRDHPPTDAEIERCLHSRPGDDPDVRENVLVHFVGWAIVFDLYRESGRFDWPTWLAKSRSTTVASARRHIERVLDPATVERWLTRLDSPDRDVRFATARGVWKLRTQSALDALLARLDVEEDVEVRVALAINALAVAGEMQLPREARDRMWRACWPVLRREELEDPTEDAALRELSRSFRWRTNADSHAALEGLRRFWAE